MRPSVALPALAVLALAAAPALAGGLTASQGFSAAPGQITTVCGVVVEAEARPGGPVLLHLADPGKTARTGFAVLIRSEDRPGFAGSPEKAYLGKRVCVTGMIRAAEGLPPHIAARGAWQLEDVQKTVDRFQAPP